LPANAIKGGSSLLGNGLSIKPGFRKAKEKHFEMCAKENQ